MLSAACAPSQTFRPAASPTSDRPQEAGAAVSVVGARPYVIESSRAVGQLWFASRLGNHWSIAGIGSFDDEAVLAGAALRWDALRSDRFAGGIEAEAGFLYASMSVPLALRLWQEVWLYSNPRLGNWGPELSGFVPVGLSAELYRGVFLRAEAQYSWEDFKYYNRRRHLGIAVGYRW